MNIVVTGGAGFIGSHLCDALLSEGHQVLALDNLKNGKLQNISEASNNKNFTFFQGDILNTNDCKEAVEKADIVYHLACLGVRHSLHSPVENHDVNATGTLNMLEASKQAGVNKFFYISTSEVYGKTISFPIKETDPTIPLTVYGSSKLAGEHYTNSYHECFDMDTTVLRIFNNYGPRAHYEGDCGEVIPRSIVNIMYGVEPVIFGDGSVTRDFYFVKDTAKVLTSLLGYTNLTGVTYNLGTGIEYTIKVLLEKIIELMPEYNSSIKHLEDRPADVPRLWVNADKIKQAINIHLGMNFEDGLKETIAYYKQLKEKRNLISEVAETNWYK